MAAQLSISFPGTIPGAIPGAIPFMLGWVAATDDFGIEPGTLFALQFFWQFPHFWAIGWFLYEDYKKGGFYMLPTGKQDKGTAVQIIMYTIWTVLVSIIPVFGFTGKLQLSIVAAILVFMAGMWMLYYAIGLFKKMTEKAAKEAGYELKVGKFPFSASGKASAAGHKDGFVKVIYDVKYGELLGAHMIGANVTEMIAEIVVARKLETTGHEMLKAVHPHPTMSEAVMEATAEAYGEVIHL